MSQPRKSSRARARGKAKGKGRTGQSSSSHIKNFLAKEEEKGPTATQDPPPVSKTGTAGDSKTGGRESSKSGSTTPELKKDSAKHGEKSEKVSSRLPVGSVKGRRRRKVEVAVATHGSDEEYTPSTRRRQVQQSIKDHFPVRRSARRCKAVLENEEFERTAEKLRTKNEEGLAVIDVEGKGRGVISTRPFTKGELICEYSGELISHEEAKRREGVYLEDSSIGCYMYYFNFKTRKLCVDATKDNGRLGRLLNHSKTSSNVVTKLMEVDGHPYLCLAAARDIRVGEELEYDYGERSKQVLESHPWLAT